MLESEITKDHSMTAVMPSVNNREIAQETILHRPLTAVITEEGWKELSKKALELRAKKTNKKLIKNRPGKGDKIFFYVDILQYEKWLDTNYPLWEFNIIPDSFKEFGGFIQLAGSLTVIEPSIGMKRTITEIGMDEIKFNRESKEPLKLMYAKSAASDCLKRCVRRLGGFADLYGYEDDEVIVNEGDIKWFVFEFIPLYIVFLKEGKIKDEKFIFQVIFKFYSGEYSREYLQSRLDNIKEKE